jgi:hypothetical protein
MAASPEVWLEALSWTKALFELITTGANVYDSYEKHRREKDTITESRRVSVAFSTYSEEEVKAVSARLKECRDRFIAEGSGPQRARCFCSVLNDFKAGNGGVLPVIDDFAKMYAQMKCDRT